jgi:hypothetical protein
MAIRPLMEESLLLKTYIAARTNRSLPAVHGYICAEAFTFIHRQSAPTADRRIVPERNVVMQISPRRPVL